jgi:hypothetical protein
MGHECRGAAWTAPILWRFAITENQLRAHTTSLAKLISFAFDLPAHPEKAGIACHRHFDS